MKVYYDKDCDLSLVLPLEFISILFSLTGGIMVSKQCEFIA